MRHARKRVMLTAFASNVIGLAIGETTVSAAQVQDSHCQPACFALLDRRQAVQFGRSVGMFLPCLVG